MTPKASTLPGARLKISSTSKRLSRFQGIQTGTKITAPPRPSSTLPTVLSPRTRTSFRRLFTVKTMPAPKLKVLNALNDQEEGFLVVNEIFQKRMSEHDNCSDFAILYRTNAQSRVFEEVLRKRNIPYKIYGGFPFTKKGDQGFAGLFRLVINPKDDESFKRVINYPVRGSALLRLKARVCQSK